MRLSVPAALLASAFCAFVSSAASADQTIRWVAPNGKGTACVQANPCSASYAAANAKAGEAWYFQAGTYNMPSPLTIKRSGTAHAPILFSAAPGAARKAVLNGSGWVAVEKSHVHIKDFKIQNVGGDAIRFECRPRTVCDGIRIENNWTLNTRYSGIAVHGGLFQWGQRGHDNVTNLVITRNRVEKANTGGVTENISVSNGINGAEISYNELVNGYNLGIDVKVGARKVKIHHNKIVGHRGTAIYLETNRRYVQDVDVYANHIMGANTGIRLAREVWGREKVIEGDGPYLERVRIFNNVIEGVRGAGILLQKIRLDLGKLGRYQDINVTNNTIVQTKNAVVVPKHPKFRNIVVRNNLAKTGGASYVFENPLTASHNISSDRTGIKASPVFVDYAGKNYRLRPGSPGVDHGTEIDAPRHDFDLVERALGTAFDIGAFER